MRGIFSKKPRKNGGLRFTPAYAGNIKISVDIFTRLEVHPRVCGEYHFLHESNYLYSGSPPRMRGIYKQHRLFHLYNRFTPAYAGNIGRFFQGARFLEVHPRVCGEYSSKIQCVRSMAGSPPRMRGIYDKFIYSDTDSRFTPAYAGNI